MWSALNWFHGLWPLVKAYSEAFIIMAALVAWAIATPAWLLPRTKLPALVAAFIVGLCTISFTVGAHLQKQRDQVRWNAAVDQEIEDAGEDGKKADADVVGDTEREWLRDPANRINSAGHKP